MRWFEYILEVGRRRVAMVRECSWATRAKSGILLQSQELRQFLVGKFLVQHIWAWRATETFGKILMVI